jgi:hypothetical protein
MEPRIEYAQTADGVSTAYTLGGDGEPVLHGFDDPVRLFELRWQE